MGHEHERPVEPFADLHVEHGHVRATLLHDPTVEGLDMAIYMDGSGSMNDEYENPVERKGGGLLWDLFGWGEAPTSTVLDNQVEPQVRWMLQYLATKDRNGLLRVAYWATGDGSQLEHLGELTGDQAAEFKFPGPKLYGKGTVMLPVLRDYIAYLRQEVPNGAKRGLAVIITDSQIHDPADVKAYSVQVAKEISAGRLPRLNFVLVGVGAQVDEEQMEEIAHDEYPGVGHLWCHRHADRMEEMADLVAVLVDETMTVAAGGTITDQDGKVLKVYEGRLPAVLEFDVPEGTTGFVLEVNGQKFPQPLPEEHGHEEDEDDHGDAPPPPPDEPWRPSGRGHGGHRH